MSYSSLCLGVISVFLCSGDEGDKFEIPSSENLRFSTGTIITTNAKMPYTVAQCDISVYVENITRAGS